MTKLERVRLARASLIFFSYVCVITLAFILDGEVFGDDRAATRPYYEWSGTTLEKDSKAVVGPVNAEQMLKIHLDTLEETAEKLNICIFERYCQIADLAPPTDGSRPRAIDFSEQLERIAGDYGRPGNQGLGKTYITIQRENPSTKVEALTINVKVETDQTQLIPQFTVISKLNGAKGRKNSRESDDIGPKTIDLPDHAPAANPQPTPPAGTELLPQ